RRRPARGADAAGPRGHLHHPDLHPRRPRTAQDPARAASPTRVKGSRHQAHAMSKTKHTSETPATHWLRQQKIPFGEHPYDYVDHGGAREAARQLGVPLHQVAKTLIMEDEQARPLIVQSEEHTSELQSRENLVC